MTSPSPSPENGSVPRSSPNRSRSLRVRLATATDREVIYRLRHEIYARELGQHALNVAGRLTDPLDSFNDYIVISGGEEIVGFVSITPPEGPSYSLDKYVDRTSLPFAFDARLYEVRLLAVPQACRRSLLALALMYASFRYVEGHGGTRIMAMGRREVLSIYLRVGLKPIGRSVQSGAVTYEILQATMPDIHAALGGIGRMLDRIWAEMSWEIGVEYQTPGTDTNWAVARPR